MARVLIVDDTEIVRRAMELALRLMGHSAISTSDAVEALAMAERNPPDLALLDFRMPHMNGATLAHELRESLGERCPKVVFVSATPQADVTKELDPAVQPAGFVKKPFHLDDLMKKVEEALAA